MTPPSGTNETYGTLCSAGSTEGASHRSGLNQALLSRLLQRRKAYDGCAGVGGGIWP